MLVKIGYELMVFSDPKELEVQDIERYAGESIVLTDITGGLSAKGSKSDMYDLLAKLSYKYDIQLM